jgi:hypothetical protein
MSLPRLASLALVVSVGSLLACSGLSGTPVPQSKLDYVGTWTGGPVTLTIEAAGVGHYEKKGGAATTEINAPITAWTATGFDAGIGPVTTSFVVSDPPHPVDGTWTMTVDGQVLTRPGPVPAGDEAPDREGKGKRRR